MKKRLLIAVVVLLLVVAVVLAACRKPDDDPTVKTIYDVSQGTTAVGAAIQKAVSLSGAENVYLALRFVVDEGEDVYNEVYDFAAMLDLDDDQNSTLSFRRYTDIQNIISCEVYYQGGTLYVNKQPAVDRASVPNVSLSQIASTLTTSAERGQIASILQLLPALGDRVFAECERVAEGDAVTYTFTVDYASIGTCVGYLVSQTGLLNVADMTRLLGLDKANSASTTKIAFVTRNQEGVGEVFESAKVLTTTGDQTVTKSLQTFRCEVLTDGAKTQAQYRIAMPDNLGSFRYYHPANLSLLGTLKAQVNSSAMPVQLFSQPAITSFNSYTYVWDVSVQSNVDVSGKWTASLVLTDQQDRTRRAAFYYNSDVLYVDLSGLNLGSWRLSAAELQRVAAGFDRTREATGLGATDYRDVILDLLVDRNARQEEVSYTLNGGNFVKLYNVLQQTLTGGALLTLPPLDIEDVHLVINTQNNTFRTLTAKASVWGCDVTLAANNPTVGPAVGIATPLWLDNCVDPLTADNITPVMGGVVRSYTQANGNTALLGAFLSSVSGEDIDLGTREIYYYNFAANVAGDGKINVISVDFDTNRNERVCSLYYHADTPNRLYVVLPSSGEATRVRSLTLKDEMRYVDFVRAINGNVETREVSDCVIANTQSSLSFTFGAAGLDALLAKLGNVLTAQSDAALPKDLGVQAVRVTLGADRAVRLVFGADRFVEFGVETINVGDQSLALTTSVRHDGVSYFDAYNLPDQIDVALGDGNANTRRMTVRLADFDAEWAFEHEPTLGSGSQMVTAYCTVLGQRVNLDFGVDCSRPSAVEVNEVPTYAAKLNGKVFGFARYSEDVAPLDVVRSFRYVKVTVGNTVRDLSLVWLHGGAALDDADWSTPDREDGTYSDYTLVPAVQNFFGHLVPLDSYGDGVATYTLAGTYTLRLDGAKITTVRDAATYLTLRTYGTAPYDPFDGATYDNAAPVFLTANGIQVDAVDEWHWDIGSIKNRTHAEGGVRDPGTGAPYTNAALVAALHDKLYALGGKYSIDVGVYNTLGVAERNITVTITVEPYVMASVSFEQCADGVSYTPQTGDYMGQFAVAARTQTSLAYNFAFAKVAVVTFENGQVQRFDARDWTVSPVQSVLMFRSYQGNARLTLGDAAGGRQTLPLHYAVAATEADGVALWGYRGDAKVELGELMSADENTTALSFALSGLNPYDYVYPRGLAVHVGSDVQYVDYDFVFEGWDENKLWHNPTPYQCTADVYNVQVTVSMQFAEKYVTDEWYFAGYVEDAEGSYVFDGEGFILYDAINPAHRGLRRYSPVAEPAVVYQKSKSGAYVNLAGEWVLYDDANDLHNGLDRYTYDVVLATPYIYEEAADGQYVYVDGVHIPYDADVHADATRYQRVGVANVVYRKGTDGIDRLVLDPNKVDYLSTEVYPALVVVTFHDGTKAVLDAVWDLSVLRTVRPDQDYTETVGLSIAMAQPLADVYMRIESTKPKYAYYRVDLDTAGEPLLNEDGFYVGGQNEVALSLLSVDGAGNLVVNDLTSLSALHAIVCGCDDEDCLGYLYFDYGDSTTDNARFAISEWRNLDGVGTALLQAAAANPDVPLQELSFAVSVIAVAHNIENEITVRVNASNMTGVVFTTAGMPLVASAMSSAGTNVYSMQASGTALTVDPYVADVFAAANYPKQMQFTVGGKACLAYVDEWDLSALAGLTPYEGTQATVYAKIHTPFGDVKVACALLVKSRRIQSVAIDGDTNRYIYVDVMKPEPFGEDVIVEGGRAIAYKKVVVQFVGDDTAYDMTMRYDITDYVAGYSAAALSAGAVNVEVGNAAGGYQTLQNYRVFTRANDVMKVSVPTTDPAYSVLADYLGGGWDGVLYDGAFVYFDDTAAANAAWRALTMRNATLVLSVGYQDELDVLRTVDYTATLGSQERLGVGYRWERATMEGKDVLRLVVWNTIAVAADHVDSVQYVSTGTNRYIALERSMLNIDHVDGVALALAYDATYTVQKLLQEHALRIVDEQLTLSDLSSLVYAADDVDFASPLAADTRLAVGNYVWRIAVKQNTLYTGYVDVAIEVAPCHLTSVEVRIAGVRVANATLLGGYTFSLSADFLSVSAMDTERTGVRILVEYYDGVGTKLVGTPYEVGEYNVRLVCQDGGYVVDLGGGADGFALTLVD